MVNEFLFPEDMVNDYLTADARPASAAPRATAAVAQAAPRT